VTTQNKANQIAALNEQIASLKEEINKANADIKVHLEKRDKLNVQFRKYREEIQALKNERDLINDVVKALKQQRDAAREKRKKMIAEIRAITDEIRALKAKKPRKSRQQLEKEIHNIEWKIQTMTLDLQEEKRLVNEVKQLEPQLRIYQKIEQQNIRITELQKEIEALEAKANASHQELISAAQRSQELHAMIITKINEATAIKREADQLHSAYVLAKERMEPLRQALKELIEQKRQLQNAIREESEMQKKTAEKVLKETLEAQARSKLQQGEKLSWEEFQLLADDESEDQQTED
jgi:uncharacterized coiled-coil DUF342 family protein